MRHLSSFSRRRNRFAIGRDPKTNTVALRDLALALQLSVDRELALDQTALQILATSAAIDAQDWRTFYSAAEEAAKVRPGQRVLMLRVEDERLLESPTSAIDFTRTDGAEQPVEEVVVAENIKAEADLIEILKMSLEAEAADESWKEPRSDDDAETGPLVEVEHDGPPVRYRHAFEVRHPSYFSSEFYDLLRAEDVGFDASGASFNLAFGDTRATHQNPNTDHPGSRDVLYRATPGVLGDPAACQGHTRQIDRILQKRDEELQILQRVATFDVMMALVSAGLAVGLAGAAHIASSKEPGVKARQLAGTPPMLTTYLLRRDTEPSPMLTRFIQRVVTMDSAGADNVTDS